MSGQYKIRSNSKDDFSDFKAAHNIAKRGGCWENTKSCLGLLFLLALCGFISSLLSGNVSAQASNDSCFPHKTLYTTTPVEIRSSNSYFASERGKTTRNKTYTVLQAKEAFLFGSCWIKINGGWLLRRADSSAIRPGSREPQPTPTPATTSTSTTTFTTTDSEKCYPYSEAVIEKSVTLYNTPPDDRNNLAGSSNRGYKGTLSAGTDFRVISSRTIKEKNLGIESCWIESEYGWMRYREGSVYPEADEDLLSRIEPVEEHVVPNVTRKNDDKCYPHRKAYTRGKVNIRSLPSTSGQIVGSGEWGDLFFVIRSQQGEDYCWLRISKGWIAKTGRVQSTKPVARAASSISAPASCSNSPSVGGSGQSAIKRALDYLCRTSNWFNYVSAKTSTINGNLGTPGGRAYVRRRHIDINDAWYPNTMEMASVIVHEACHIYQWDEGRWHGDNKAREVECINKQIEYVSQVAPGSRWLRTLRDYVKNPGVSYGG